MEVIIKAQGDVLVKGSNFKSNGNLEIDANDITVMGAYNYSKSTIKRGNRKRGSIEIEEDWSVAKSSFAVDGNFRYKLNKTDANGGANKLEVIGSDFKVAGDVRGNVEIEKVKQREVHVSIQQNWDSGIIGMTKGPIGDIGQTLYDLTPWGQNDEIKRKYLIEPSFFSKTNKENPTVGTDQLNDQNSRHKESLHPMREDADHELVNMYASGESTGFLFDQLGLYQKLPGSNVFNLTFSDTENGIKLANETKNLINELLKYGDIGLTKWLNNNMRGFSDFSRYHDKCIGSGGGDRGAECFGNSGWDTISLLSAGPRYFYAELGQNNLGNPFNGGIFGKKQDNYNKAWDKNAVNSTIEIGGKFYVDDKESSPIFRLMIDHKGQVVERVYGGEIIKCGYQGNNDAEVNKYLQNNPNTSSKKVCK